MRKEVRQRIFDKFGGRCSYCGEELQKGWHVDELEPCIRLYEWENSHYRDKATKEKVKNLKQEDFNRDAIEHIPARQVFKGYQYPERLHIDNQMPSCASCNINKHSGSLEEFRNLITGFIKSLNRDSVQYKVAKRYGLIEENIKPIKFYFETLNNL